MFQPLSLFNRSRSQPATILESTPDPWLRLQHEMNRLFDEAFVGFGFPTAVPSSAQAWPSGSAIRLDVRETDTSLEIEADLPGVEDSDIDVEVTDNVLKIRGEKKSEREEKKDKHYRLVERTSGSFVRSLALPFDVDPDRVEAVFRNGVLKLTLPKPPQSESRSRRIEINRP